MKIKFAPATLPSTGTLVLFVASGGKLSPLAEKANAEAGGHLARAMKSARFEGNRDQVLDLLVPAGNDIRRVFMVGIGDSAKLTGRDLEYLGGTVAGALQAAKLTAAALAADFPLPKEMTAPQAAALVGSGARLRVYGFLKYKSKPPKDRVELATLTILTADQAKAQRSYRDHDAVAVGVHFARDLVNEPANVLVPAEFARRARELQKLDVKVEVLGPKELAKLGMGALLGVAQGSVNEPRLVVMEWQGGRKGAAPVAFIGKGVTFDTGGISIKPAAGMEDMKGDMAGAACVAGLMQALAGRKAKVNAVGLIGVVENMPDGRAQRPGDIVTSMSGKTIAVLNTDAEGRLVLADVLWYAQKRFKPRFMVNLATLTGAIMVALGKEHAGLFSNNDELAERLSAAGIDTGERVWRMPLSGDYDRMIDSDVADMKNIGGRNAGAITAAQFLQRFVNDVPWAHLDVAGTAMDSNKSPISQGWASGWGVRLLNRLVVDHYES